MENWKLILAGIIIIIALLTFFSWIEIKRQKKRKTAFRKKTQKFLEKIRNMPSSHNNQKILEYDKILDQCLAEKFPGKKLSTGGKMKKFGKNFQHENNIWFAHKLRNTIAHQVGFEITDKNFRAAEKYFLQEIAALLQ